MSRPRGKRPVSQQSPIEILKSLFPSSTKAGTKGDGGDPMNRAFGVIWYIGAAGFLLYVALGSFTSIEPGQVAVRINNITGGAGNAGKNAAHHHIQIAGSINAHAHYVRRRRIFPHGAQLHARPRAKHVKPGQRRQQKSNIDHNVMLK